MLKNHLNECVNLLLVEELGGGNYLERVVECLAQTIDALGIGFEIRGAQGRKKIFVSKRSSAKRPARMARLRPSVVQSNAPFRLPGSIRKRSRRFENKRSIGGIADASAELTFHWGPATRRQEARRQEDRCIAMFEAFLEHSDTIAHIEPVTRLPNYLVLNRDLKALFDANAYQDSCLILVELIEFGKLMRIYLAEGRLAVLNPLRVFGDRLSALLVGSSRLYSTGPGYFCIVAHRIGDRLDDLIGSIEQICASTFQNGNVETFINGVVGFVRLADSLDDVGDVVRKAAVSAEQAKLLKVRRHQYDRNFDQTQIRKYKLLHDIPRAIEKGEFWLAFQPKLNVCTNRFESAEALLRWAHPLFGNVSPAEFIPLAEGTKFIHAISRWVFTECLKTIAILQDAGIMIPVALNISAHNLADPEFVPYLARASAEHGIAPGFVQIECTEYSALASAECTRNLKAISAMGFCVALDDFGNGYSNLSCLNDLPIDYLKIDRSLVSQIEGSARSFQLLTGIVQLGKSLNFKIVAEGVETAGIAERVASLGIDEMQGYFFSRPVPLANLMEVLQSSGPLPPRPSSV